MGYSRFDGVKRVEGSSMPFENYLKQINLLYPNLPDIYIKYLEMIYEFEAKQLERLLLLNQHEIADAIVTSIFNALSNVKIKDNLVFQSFVENFFYKERASELFDIHSLTFEEWLQEISNMYPDDYETFIAYFNLVHNFYFEQYQILRNDNLHEEYRDQLIEIGIAEILDFKNTNNPMYLFYLNQFIDFVVSELADADTTLSNEEYMTLFNESMNKLLDISSLLYSRNSDGGFSEYQGFIFNLCQRLRDMVEVYRTNFEDETFIDVATSLFHISYYPLIKYDEMESWDRKSRALFEVMARAVISQIMTDTAENNYYPTACASFLGMSMGGDGSDKYYFTRGNSIGTASYKMSQVVGSIFSDMASMSYSDAQQASSDMVNQLSSWLPWMAYVVPSEYERLKNSLP